MDVDKAVELANLTYKQRQAIYLHYIEDMTQEKAAEEMGITQQALWHHVQGALKRILKVFKAWNYVEVIVSLESDTDEDKEE